MVHTGRGIVPAVFGGALLAALAARPAIAQGPVITEFLADSDGSILDSDGEESDWIEIQNRGASSADLLGWALTDDSRDLLKWRFPRTVLDPGAYLVVFASGKDRAVAGAELHASFKLDADGGYLALVAPDLTIASEFPRYPRQRPGYSYGLGRKRIDPPLVGAGAAARVLVPGGGGFGLSWTGGFPFDDHAWTAATLGLGYPGAGGPAPPLPMAYYDFDGSLRDTSGGGHDGEIRGGPTYSTDVPPKIGAGKSLHFDGVDDFVSVALDVSEGPYTLSLWFKAEAAGHGIFAVVGGDLGANGHDRHVFLNGGNIASRVWNNETISSTGKNYVDNKWHHLAHVFGDWAGGQRIYVDGALVVQGSKASSDFDWQERINIGFSNDAASPYFLGSLDEVSLWDVALTEIQIKTLAAGGTPLALAGYAPWISTDVGAALAGKNASLFVRIPFDVPADLAFNSLILGIRYDDGFVAFVNGVEAARRNAPDPLTFDARATADRPTGAAVRVEEIDLGPAIGALRPGANILAFQALNDRPDGSDFLLAPELVAALDDQDRYLTPPTPGEPNSGGVAGFVADPIFDADHGFYRDPLDVSIFCETDGAAIYYTTDGSAPSPTNAVATIYAGPIHVAKTLVLRAAAFREDLTPSKVISSTFIFSAQVARQAAAQPGLPTSWGGYAADYGVDQNVVTKTLPGYGFEDALLSIPTVSLATAPADLFSASSGIYANPGGRGLTWERATSIELILPDGRSGFQADCGIRMHGNSSRDTGFTPKHPFRVYFRARYGQKKLKYRLFEETKVDSFGELLLRACSTDSWPVVDGGYVMGVQRWAAVHGTYLRDQYMRDAQIDLGRPSGHGIYVNLFLDGLYWGIYNLAERPTDDFCANYLGGQKEEYDVLKDFAELDSGNGDAWNAMISLAGAGLATDAAYQKIQGKNPDGTRNPAYPIYLDVENLIDYMILHIASGAEDWPNHNWWGARRRGSESTGFKFFSWDQEISNDSLVRVYTLFQTPFEQPAPNPSPSYMSGQCSANASYRRAFGDRVHQLLFDGGLLGPEKNSERWLRRQKEIDRAIVGESARWGDYRRTPAYKREVEWLAEMNWERDSYWPGIQPIAVQRFRNVNLYPKVDAPWFQIAGKRRIGGWIAPGDLLALKISATPRKKEVTFVPADAPATACVPADASLGTAWRDAGYIEGAKGETWKRGANGAGYETGSGYETVIRLDLKEEMLSKRLSFYMRIPFTVAAQEDIDRLTALKLRMLYDDGFVAYLNGSRVAAANAPDEASLAWSSAATAANEAVITSPVEYDLTSSIGLLHPGTNLLAMQGLNFSTASSDLLVLGQLVGVLAEEDPVTGDISYTLDGADPLDPSARAYTEPIPIEHTVAVKARARDNGEWSALARVIFTNPADIPLRISEISYQPAPRDDGGDPDEEEFIELVNAGDAPIALAGIHLRGGVEFDLGTAPGGSLAPGERILVVEDVRSFTLRYGAAGKRIAGHYSGKLANEGERIVLEGPIGETLLDFAYDPAWYPETAGGGRTLVIADEGGPPEAWSLASSWKPSAEDGGSPGEPEPGTGGGRRRPADATGDGVVDIADVLSLLFGLFLGGGDAPCGGTSLQAGGNLPLLDSTGDGAVDLSDVVGVLLYLFQGGAPPALGVGCVRIDGCADACRS